MKPYEQFARLLTYPTDRFVDHVSELGASMDQHQEESLRLLEEFSDAVNRLSVNAMKELYTQTFDLMAVCSPYVGIHLFGEDNYKRGGLMAKLNDEFRRREFHVEKELPDHLSVILRYMETADQEEVRDLVEFVLRKPLTSMIAILEKSGNPYGILLKSLQAHIDAERNISSETAHAMEEK